MAAAELLLAAGADFQPLPYPVVDIVPLKSGLGRGRKAREMANKERDEAIDALMEEEVGEGDDGQGGVEDDVLLIDQGFQRITSNTTYLHEAAKTGFSDLIRFALHRGRVHPDAFLPTYWRTTPLFVAVKHSHARVVRELLAAGESSIFYCVPYVFCVLYIGT